MPVAADQDKYANGSVKDDHTLLPWGAIPYVTKVMEWGAKQKYKPLGFYDVPQRRQTYLKSVLRHLVEHAIATARGLDPVDKESGLPLLHHAAASLLIAIDDSCEHEGRGL